MDIGRDKVWWPMKEFVGKDRTGKKVTREVFRNVKTGETHAPQDKEGNDLGWNGAPPPVEGERVPIVNEAYRRNYDLIDWHRGRKTQEGEPSHAKV